MIIHTKKKKKKKYTVPDEYYSPPVRIKVNSDDTEVILELTKKSWKSYGQYLKSSTWIRKRKEILKRDKRKCKLCGNKATQVHHKKYSDWGTEKNKDLISICDNCHRKVHKR